MPKIERITLWHLRLPLVHFFETSFGRVTHQETLLVRLEAEGLAGYGECPASERPTYSEETVETCALMIREFLAPLLREHPLDRAELFRDRARLVRGNRMAKAGVEMALCDLFARREGKALSAFLGGERDEVPVGISLGIQDSVAQLMERIRASLERGYRRIKVKVKPGWDHEPLRAVRRELPEIPLMADANGAYRLEELDHLKGFDEFNLMMLEQPLSYDDYVDHARVQAAMKTPLCLDESIRSADDARRALQLDSCRIVNIKQARVGGPLQARALHDTCLRRRVPVWCGGLLESGIGRAHNVALASLRNFSLPGDISESRRYYERDIIDPPFELTSSGTLRVPNGAGLGVDVREDLVSRYTLCRQEV